MVSAKCKCGYILKSSKPENEGRTVKCPECKASVTLKAVKKRRPHKQPDPTFHQSTLTAATGLLGLFFGLSCLAYLTIDPEVYVAIASLGTIGVVIGIPALGLHFLPFIIASYKKNPSASFILLVNIFVGWTGLGWLCLIFWSLNGDSTDNYKPCLNCGKTIEGDAAICIYCASTKQLVLGEYLAEKERIAKQERRDSHNPATARALRYACVVLTCGLVLIFVTMASRAQAHVEAKEAARVKNAEESKERRKKKRALALKRQADKHKR